MVPRCSRTWARRFIRSLTCFVRVPNKSQGLRARGVIHLLPPPRDHPIDRMQLPGLLVFYQPRFTAVCVPVTCNLPLDPPRESTKQAVVSYRSARRRRRRLPLNYGEYIHEFKTVYATLSLPTELSKPGNRLQGIDQRVNSPPLTRFLLDLKT